MSGLDSALKAYANINGQGAADDIEKVLLEWQRRVDAKTQEVASQVDKAALKAALFCEGVAKENAQTMIYDIPIPTDAKGKPLWKRTGLYRASIGSGADPNKAHNFIIYNSVPYAKLIEFGGSSDFSGFNNVRSRRARPVMTSAVFQHKSDIKQIMSSYLKEVCK